MKPFPSKYRQFSRTPKYSQIMAYLAVSLFRLDRAFKLVHHVTRPKTDLKFVHAINSKKIDKEDRISDFSVWVTKYVDHDIDDGHLQH